MDNLKSLPVDHRFGIPSETLETAQETVTIWSILPIAATKVTGEATEKSAQQIAAHFRNHCEIFPELIAIHEWPQTISFRNDNRKLLQQVSHDITAKQRKIIIYLGPADSIVQQMIRTTIKTISSVRKLSNEFFDDEPRFEQRVMDRSDKYCAGPKYRILLNLPHHGWHSHCSKYWPLFNFLNHLYSLKPRVQINIASTLDSFNDEGDTKYRNLK